MKHQATLHGKNNSFFLSSAFKNTDHTTQDFLSISYYAVSAH